MNPTKKEKPLLPYFHAKTGNYFLELEPGRFRPLTGRDVKLHLMKAGDRIDVEDDAGLKFGDRVLVVAQLERSIDYAGPLAGHCPGPFMLPDGRRVLVTCGVKAVQPGKSRDFPNIERFFGELLGEQVDYLLCWLKVALESLERRDFKPGQLMVFAGPSGCGKSFLQWFITRLLGGRSAKPYRYMTESTTFNGDLAGAEHLTIEDENASPDIRSRMTLGASIKQFTVNVEMSVHDKGQQAITLPTYKRLTMSVNDEIENLMILPPIETSIMDKIMLFKCGKATLSADREENARKMTAEMPALVSMLKHLKIPRKLQDKRYGIAAWHHPEILEVISDASPQQRLLNLIDQVIFKNKEKVKAWEGTSEELEHELRRPESGFAFAVDKLFTFNTACPVYLARLARRYPERVEQFKHKGRSQWTIRRAA